MSIFAAAAFTIGSALFGRSERAKAKGEANAAKRKSAFDSYNSYRGEIEQSRKQAETDYSGDRSIAVARLSASGVRQGSKAWNSRIASVQTGYETQMADISKREETFKQGSMYQGMQKEYDSALANIKQGRGSSTGILSDEIFEQVKPSFQEYQEMNYGSEDQQNAARLNVEKRRESAGIGGTLKKGF